MRLKDVLDERVDWRHKGFPPLADTTVGGVREQGWSLLAGDLPPPVMVLKEDALDHNVDAMNRFCEAHGVSLAPHGKTTMAPQIFQRQIDAGAWAITAANVSQVRVMRGFGVNSVLLANQLVHPGALRWVARELAGDPSFSFLCLVDSEPGVALMEESLAEAPQARPIRVLVEIGAEGARAGARSDDYAIGVAEAVRRSRYLELAGVEGYEGVIKASQAASREEAVNRFLRRLRDLSAELDQRGAFAHLDEVVVTAGGSVFFDKVAEIAGATPLSKPRRVVLRSGCYVTHDHGVYDRNSPMGSGSASEEHLLPALEVWGEVLSRPEPGLAIVNMGKRDAPYDSGLPVPRRLLRRSRELEEVDGSALDVTAMNDQHAYVSLGDLRLEVGDLVGCGISHPCTAFDKWRTVPLVDDGYAVTGAVRTYF